MSRGLVRSLGGDLRVTSGPAGTTMSVVLPASEIAPTSVPQLLASPKRGRTMFLVDDDPAVGRASARSLGSMFDVELVSDVGGALEKLYERSYDVVLSGMQMPGGGGRLLYERIAAHSPNAAQRMIMFSGGAPSGAGADSAFFEKHGVAVLGKPLSVDELLRASNRICDEMALPAPVVSSR